MCSENRCLCSTGYALVTISEKRMKFLEEQSMDNLFILNVCSVDADCREYFQLSRAREMAKFKKQLEEEAQDSTRAVRRPLPIPTVTADENESREENVQNESVDNANV
ncbi:unnamed protein product [Calypogeia fissa]